MSSKEESKSMYFKVQEMAEIFFSPRPESEKKKDPSDKYSYLDQIHENAPGAVWVFDNASLGYDYFSSNIRHIMGYEASQFIEGGLKFAMSLVDPEHNKIYNRYIIPQMFKYIGIYTLKRRMKDIRFCYTFRIRKKNGDYLWAMHTMGTMEVNAIGLPSKTLVFMTDITEFKSDDLVGFTVTIKGKDGVYKPIYSGLYPHNSKMSFSERELDILHQLCSGKTSVQIAEELGISHHTVNTHRKKMLEKTGSQNTAELLQKSYIKGIVNFQ